VTISGTSTVRVTCWTQGCGAAHGAQAVWHGAGQHALRHEPQSPALAAVAVKASANADITHFMFRI